MKISITDTEKRRNGSNSYVAFNIESHCSDGDGSMPAGEHDVWRRFSEFVSLREYLIAHYPAVVLPGIPPKNPLTQKTGEYIEKRKQGLQAFLRRAVQHPSLIQDEHFCNFFHSDSWAPIKSASNTIMLSRKSKEPNLELISKEENAKELKKILTDLLTAFTTLRNKNIEIVSNYERSGEAITKWSEIETHLSSTLEATGSFLEKEAAELRKKIEREDESFVFVLEEYSQLMDSIVEVVRAHVRKEIETEKQQDFYASKVRELQELEASGTGNVGLMGYFKKTTPEQYQNQLRLLRYVNEEEKAKSEKAKEEMEAYTQLVMRELNFFDEQKVDEFRRIFIKYTKIQVDYFKQELENWSTFKAKTLQAM